MTSLTLYSIGAHLVKREERAHAAFKLINMIIPSCVLLSLIVGVEVLRYMLLPVTTTISSHF